MRGRSTCAPEEGSPALTPRLAQQKGEPGALGPTEGRTWGTRPRPSQNRARTGHPRFIGKCLGWGTRHPSFVELLISHTFAKKKRMCAVPGARQPTPDGLL